MKVGEHQSTRSARPSEIMFLNLNLHGLSRHKVLGISGVYNGPVASHASITHACTLVQLSYDPLKLSASYKNSHKLRQMHSQNSGNNLKSSQQSSVQQWYSHQDEQTFAICKGCCNSLCYGVWCSRSKILYIIVVEMSRRALWQYIVAQEVDEAPLNNREITG